MLRLMRKNASSWIIKILLGIVILAFIFIGTGSYKSQKANRIALVNGTPISLDNYRTAYNNLIEQYRRQYRGNFTDEMVKLLQIDKQALDMLINEELIVQQAGKYNIIISDEELEREIKKIEAFHLGGVFNPQQYERVLNRLRMKPEEFEYNQRKEMLVEKLRTLITDNVKVSQAEAREWYDWKNTAVSIDTVLFNPNDFTNIHPTQDEIKEFFQQHQENYKTDPKIKVRYVHFNPDLYKLKTDITDEEINEYYNANQQMFFKPKMVEARHILLKVDSNAGPEVIENKKNETLKILDRAKKGENFAELAKKYSECPSAKNGGYLGSFKKEDMVKPFAEKAFSMNAGDISDPVKTSFGWHIIKVEKINEEKTLPLTAVYSEIKDTLKEEKAKTAAFDEAEDFFDIAINGEDLEQIAKEKNLALVTTDFFTQKFPYKEVKDNIKFTALAFDLPVMEISDVQDFSDGYYILQVIEKVPEKIPELDNVIQNVTSDLIKEKQDSEAKRKAETLLSSLKKGAALKNETEKSNMKIISTGFFKKTGIIPDIGQEQNVIDAAFLLSEKNMTADNVVKGKKGYYVIQLKGKKVLDADNFEKEKPTEIENLLALKKSKSFGEWLAQVKNKSKISIEEIF